MARPRKNPTDAEWAKSFTIMATYIVINMLLYYFVDYDILNKVTIGVIFASFLIFIAARIIPFGKIDTIIISLINILNFVAYIIYLLIFK